jgi:hypothetical protein
MVVLARVRDVTEREQLGVQPDHADLDTAAAVEDVGRHWVAVIATKITPKQISQSNARQSSGLT